MAVFLRFTGHEPEDLRWQILADGQHAGGITVHSIKGVCFSYGIAVAPEKRRRGIAAQALSLLFPVMAERGFTRCTVQVRADNDASKALHSRLGFQPVGMSDGIITLEKQIAP